jgi:hypothetical protein
MGTSSKRESAGIARMRVGGSKTPKYSGVTPEIDSSDIAGSMKHPRFDVPRECVINTAAQFHSPDIGEGCS